MRLSFGFLEPEQIDEGLRRLARRDPRPARPAGATRARSRSSALEPDQLSAPERDQVLAVEGDAAVVVEFTATSSYMARRSASRSSQRPSASSPGRSMTIGPNLVEYSSTVSSIGVEVPVRGAVLEPDSSTPGAVEDLVHVVAHAPERRRLEALRRRRRVLGDRRGRSWPIVALRAARRRRRSARRAPAPGRSRPRRACGRGRTCSRRSRRRRRSEPSSNGSSCASPSTHSTSTPAAAALRRASSSSSGVMSRPVRRRRPRRRPGSPRCPSRWRRRGPARPVRRRPSRRAVADLPDPLGDRVEVAGGPDRPALVPVPRSRARS